MPFSNSFMKPEIYKGWYFRVETTAGIEVVPAHACGRTCATHVEALLNYLEGKPLDSDELIVAEDGWLARLSAPGYLDCTPWTVHASEREAHEHLEEMYGED